MMPPDIQAPYDQSKLAWAFSLYAGAFALLYSFAVFPAPGLRFLAFTSIGALLSAWLAGWIASKFGYSTYGVVAGVITPLLFSLLLPGLVALFAFGVYLLSKTPSEFDIALFAGGIAVGFAVALKYAAPAAVVGTILFHVVLVMIRWRQWFAFEQRWL